MPNSPTKENNTKDHNSLQDSTNKYQTKTLSFKLLETTSIRRKAKSKEGLISIP